MKGMGIILCLALVLTIPFKAKAQSPIEGCIDSKGYNVLWIEDDSLLTLAQADFASDNWPTIRYNPNVMPSIHPKTRMFFEYRECAHHLFDHLDQREISYEQEELADCWALNTLHYRKLVSASQLQEIQMDISGFNEVDWIRIPGKRRTIHVNSCLK